MILEFCPSCKKVLLPDLSRRKLRCSACGYERQLVDRKIFMEDTMKAKQILVLGDSNRYIKKECPKCGNDRICYWSHGRSKENSPEPANRFFRCPKCGHRWKEM